MKYFLKIFKESIVIVAISSIIGLCSGMLLSFNEEVLYTFPVLLLILPALNSLIGDISTVLVARLTTHLYVGTLPPKIQKTKRILDDFIGLSATLLLGFIFLVIFGYSLGIATGITIVNPFLMISIIFLTILIIFLLMFILLFLGAIFLFKRGMDPNNFLIPFITSLADFLTPLFLIIFIIIFL